MEEKEKLFIGIDLNNVRAMVSLFYDEMEEPETVSTIPGEEHFRIPTAIYAAEDGTCYYGDEAVRRRDDPEGTFFSGLYEKALSEENVIYRNRFVQFLRRLLKFADKYEAYELEPVLTLTVPDLTDDAVRLFQFVREELGFPWERFFLTDYGESFYGFVYHQDPSVYTHDVALFDYEKEQISYILLHADASGMIRRVTSQRDRWEFPGYLEGMAASMDEYFAGIIGQAFDKVIASAVYFVGDGFDGGWMNTCLRRIGPNKRVFKGKNLYTVGACYIGELFLKTEGWNYYYDCPYKMQGEITLKVLRDNDSSFIRLVELGENWFVPTKKFLLLYDGNPVLETYTRVRERMNARVDSFVLEYLPEREPRSIRLGIRAFPKSGTEVSLRVTDEGFGEQFDPSGKVWEFSIFI